MTQCISSKRPTRHLRRVGTWVLSIALFGSCSSGPNSGGPLNQDYPPGEICTPVGADGRATIGHDVLVNSGSREVVILEVRALLPSDLLLLDAYLVPVHGDLVGIRSMFPPNPEDLLAIGITWSDAIEAVGATIPPDSGDGVVWNLVVGVELDEDARFGTTSGFEIDYKVDDRRYRYITPTSLEIRPDTCIGDAG